MSCLLLRRHPLRCEIFLLRRRPATRHPDRLIELISPIRYDLFQFMGCTASKLDNEDTVRRCKERRRLIKESVYARHHLAAAHSDYCRSLRVTGSALVAFASGEPLSVSHHTPAVLLRTPSSAATFAVKPPAFIPPPDDHIPSPPASPSPRPPSPPLSTTSSHHHRHQPSPQLPRRKKPIRLPHILSDSSFSSSPPPLKNFTYNAAVDSNYSTTPSQASSVWNWDNLYPPPSPPDSEHFNQLQKSKKTAGRTGEDHSDDEHHYTDDKDSIFYRDHYQGPFGVDEHKHFDERGSDYSSKSRYTYNSSAKNHTKQGPLPSKGQWVKKEEETEREEIQCSEWEEHDHYSSTSSSSEEDAEEELKSRLDFGTHSNFGSVKSEAAAKVENSHVNLNSKFSSKLEKLPSEDGKYSASWRTGNKEGTNSDRRIAVRHKDLAEIAAAIREYFDKAAASGEQLSEILETGRAQLDRSFKQLKKTVYHSSGMLSNLSSSWTSKPPLAVKYQFEPNSIDDSGGPKSLWSTLERLSAWEKKLYQEVKAREGVKIEHEKKLSVLQSQEYRGGEETKLDKTKASINRLQSLIVVTSQAVSSTSASIVTLRDSDLVPQLVELCHGSMYMWKSMNQYHAIQNDIVQQVRGLVNRTTKGESATDLHKQATRDLESAVSAWHSSFCRLIKFQRDFICSLHGWFKLTLIAINTEPNNRELPEVFSFFDEWKLALERIPDTVASEAIKSFINVVHSIYLKQMEESMVGIGFPDSGPDNGHILDARDPLADKKAELAICQRRVEDEMLKHSKAVDVTRAMTLNNIQTGLPGVFQAMTSFSSLITESLEMVCTRSYSIK